MKKVFFLLIFFILRMSIQAQEFDLLAPEAIANWTGYGELGGFEQTGSIRALSGKAKIENNQLVSGEIIFDMTTISNEDKVLEKHLKAKDFFFTKRFPTATFIIESVTSDTITGTLTIRGINQKVSFLSLIEQKENALVVQGDATIDRTDFDIKYNSSSYFQDLGNYAIKNEFDLNFKVVFRAH